MAWVTGEVRSVGSRVQAQGLGVQICSDFAQAKDDLTGVSICRKCIAPKPARTHHCSICNR